MSKQVFFPWEDKGVSYPIDVVELYSKQVVEIESINEVVEYHCRYIATPTPIILTDLSDGDPGDPLEFFGENLSINGETDEQTSSLGENFHKEILDRAIELATLDYKNGDLKSRIELNTRNE